MGTCIIASAHDPRVLSNAKNKEIQSHPHPQYLERIAQELNHPPQNIIVPQTQKMEPEEDPNSGLRTTDIEQPSECLAEGSSSSMKKSRFSPKTTINSSRGDRFHLQEVKSCRHPSKNNHHDNDDNGSGTVESKKLKKTRKRQHSHHHLNSKGEFNHHRNEENQNSREFNFIETYKIKTASERIQRRKPTVEFLPIKLNKMQSYEMAIEDSQLPHKMQQDSTIVGPSVHKDTHYLQSHQMPEIQSEPLNSTDEDFIESTFSFEKQTKLNQDIHFQDGSHYVGEWQDGMKNGKGKLVWNGGVYEGRWKDNEMSGQGKIVFENGEVFEGNFVHHKAQGHGTFYFKDESVYRGNWRHNKQNGHGVQEWPNNEHYTGNWVEGSKEGYGELVYADGSFYKGLFKENEWHGEGEYEWSGNQHYKGHWEHNKKEGRGKLVFASGEVYEGDFSNNKMHGQGKLTLKDGTVHEGLWEHGRKEGPFKETTPDGQTKTGFWTFGKLLYELKSQ